MKSIHHKAKEDRKKERKKGDKEEREKTTIK
jgi:hypothetical protein